MECMQPSKTGYKKSEVTFWHLFQVLIQLDAAPATYPQIYEMILEPMLYSALKYEI